MRPCIVACTAILMSQLATAQEKKPLSPLDKLKRDKVSNADLVDAGGGNMSSAPSELVATPPVLRAKSGRYTCVAFSPDGKLVLLGTEDGQIVTWDLNQKHSTVVRVVEGRVWDVRPCPYDKTYGAIGGRGNALIRPVLKTGKSQSFDEVGGVNGNISFSSDQRFLYSTFD